MKWIKGRQNGGYFKAKLFISQFFRVDGWILKMPSGSEIEFHIDPAPVGFKHWRLNFVFWRGASGGRLIVGTGKSNLRKGSAAGFLTNRLNIFRPDSILHRVTKVEVTTYALSFGWLQKE